MANAPVKHDSNTDIFRGQLFIFVEENPIAYGKDASLEVSVAEIDVSNKMMASGWDVSLPGNKSYTVSSESLMTHVKGQESFDSLLDRVGETFPFYMGEAKVTEETPTGGKFELDKTKPYRAGTIMITSLSEKSTSGDIATCSASFKGVGALVKGEVTPPTT